MLHSLEDQVLSDLICSTAITDDHAMKHAPLAQSQVERSLMLKICQMSTAVECNQILHEAAGILPSELCTINCKQFCKQFLHTF